MITNSLIITLKERYYGHKLLYVRFSNEDYIFRSLTKKEYKDVSYIATNQYELEELICSVGCVYPEEHIDFDRFECAGFPTTVSEQIKEISGFRDIRAIMYEYNSQKELNSLEENCMNLIKAFIPEYTYEQMEEWTWLQLMKATARAEKVAALKGFDYHLTDHSEEVVEEFDKINSDNKEFIMELYQNGIDPMVYFKDELIFKQEILDFPLIGGVHWNDEVILDVIRKQSSKKKIKQ